MLDKVNRALGYLEQLFPTSIGEACFIDRDGPENARMVRGVRATVANLSPDESGASFFAPTFALRQGQVYQATPYVSPDTKEWVVANSTLMPTRDGAKRAIVHFEVTVESFRQVAATLSSQFDVAVVDARTGQMVIDSRRPQRVGAPLGDPDDHRFRPIVAAGAPRGRHSVGDRPAAYQRLQRLPGNANDWYVVATARVPVGALYGVSRWSIAIVAVALVLLPIAAVSFLAHRILVAHSLTDALTGIGNRRKLKLDLERGLKEASADRPLLLMLFDLNGFKGYNDTFGHPAGDALLIRLANALQTAMTEQGGTAYRLGGDEFCILAGVDPDATGPIVAAASQALSEHGPGFSIAASYGAILLPQETQDPSEAMRLVDQRMYAQKTSSRRSVDRQTRDVLLRALQERNPELAERHAAVARLAQAVGQRMELPPKELTELRLAAELHDVGKMAISEQILHKPGPLDDDEWAFVRCHPLIGERIIAVCDAFTAMTSPRAYAAELSVAAAVAELQRAAGTQFDPAVVAAFAEMAAELVWPSDRPAAADHLDPAHHRG